MSVDAALADTLRSVARTVAAEAAGLLTEGISRTRTSVDTKSTSTDMVTEMDRASEALLVERLLALRPDDGILGEEGASVTGSSGIRWVIDPLDGTTNYVYGYPGWNVSVGADVDGTPVAGAVVVPALGATYSAAAGRGATRNDEPVRVRDAVPLGECMLGTGFNYDPATRERQMQGLSRIISRLRDVRRSGAAAADLCSVAAGQLDAYAETGLAPWDRVAGTAIATEAGARVGVHGSPLIGDLTVAAHPQRYDELTLLLHEAGFLS